jgi:hypothetical protein
LWESAVKGLRFLVAGVEAKTESAVLVKRSDPHAQIIRHHAHAQQIVQQRGVSIIEDSLDVMGQHAGPHRGIALLPVDLAERMSEGVEHTQQGINR